MTIGVPNSQGRSGWAACAALWLMAAFAGTALATAGLPPPPQEPLPSRAVRKHGALAKLPLSFEENRGQTNSGARFLARVPGGSVHVAADRVLIQTVQVARPGLQRTPPPVKQSWLAMHLVGADPRARVVGKAPQSGTVNYLRGADPTRWRTGLNTFGRVRVFSAYPGVDVEYYGNPRDLEYDFLVAPGADPGRIRLGFRGGAPPRLTAQGDLLLTTPTGEIRQTRPVAYQQISGRRVAVQARYRVAQDVRLTVGAYDTTQPLVIDPVVLSYATFLGGGFNDSVGGVSADMAGNLYVTGFSVSTNLPVTAGAFQPTFRGGGTNAGDGDAFVARVNPTGTRFDYVTYLGGSTTDFGNGIRVLADGSVVVAGDTFSTNFPVTASSMPRTNNRQAGFVTRLNPLGTGLVWSSYLKATAGFAQCLNVDTDLAGDVYVVGSANAGLPTQIGVFQRQPNGMGTTGAFVAKFPAAGPPLTYLTYLGGSAFATARGIDVDATGRAVVVGETSDANFPTTPGTFQTTRQSSSENAFVTRLNASGTGLSYSTYLGGTSTIGQTANDVVVDSLGRAWVVGQTTSADFPVTANAFQGTYAGGVVGASFITALNDTGTGLFYSTFLSVGTALGVDRHTIMDNTTPAEIIAVGGFTQFPRSFPSMGPIDPIVPSSNGGWEALFVTQLTAAAPVRVEQVSPVGDGAVHDTTFRPTMSSGTTATAYFGGGFTRLPITAGAAQMNFAGNPNDGGLFALTIDLAGVPPPTLTLSNLSITGPANPRVEFDLTASRMPAPGTTFEVQRREGMGAFTTISTGTLAITQRITDATVVAGTTYSYRVQTPATSTLSNVLDATVPPIQLTLGSLSVGGPPAPRVSFQLTTTGAPPAGAMYTIERAESGGAFIPIQFGPLLATQMIEDTTVTTGITYQYRASLNGSAVVSNTLTAAVPGGLMLTLANLAVSAGANPAVEFDLTTSAPPPMGAMFAIERQTGTGPFTQVQSGPLAATQRVRDTTIAFSTTYQYRAMVVGTATTSNVLNAVIPPAPTTRADLRVTSFAPPRNQGTNVNYQFRLSIMNAGPDPATRVVVNYTVPAGGVLIGSAQPSDFTGAFVGTRTLTFTAPTLARGRTATFLITASQMMAGTFPHQVNIVSDSIDPSVANNTRTFDTVFSHADLQVRNLTGTVTRAGSALRIDGNFIVSNTGRGRSNPTNLRLLIGTTNAATNPPSTLLQVFNVPALLGNAMSRQTFGVTIPNPGITGGQTVFLIGVVDPNQTTLETSETNNTRSSQVRVR